MYHFQYVAKKELKPAKKQLMELIHKVQDEVRDNFTFQYEFVGSVKRNMVTWDVKSNVGFDFDVNIRVMTMTRSSRQKTLKRYLCVHSTIMRGSMDMIPARIALEFLQLK